ncbi:MAG TPA: phosphotransferase [Mesorhizobium sp.]|jgi:aminoglycoside phosphotransferase (APT) family kinase protein|nr:phosphotransferase [Mesorhizobium sp.]
MDDDAAIRASLESLGLLAKDEPLSLQALTGGVSSDIRLAETPRQRFCVKRALPRLKVAAVWEVPVGRSASEAAFLRTASSLAPGLAPNLLGEDHEAGLFVMEYLDGADHPVWKAELLEGRADPGFAALVGERMAKLQAAACAQPGLAETFATDALFEALRLDPYLRATAQAHPDLAPVLVGLADRTAATKLTLVHGDLSPKNILAGPDGPVLLDAECAWWGDPAFDLAFCLNHLALKSVHLPGARRELLESFDRLAKTYLAGVSWEKRDALEERAAMLLPGLMLARIDGKSPVEYLSEASRETVRAGARNMLRTPPRSLSAFRLEFLRLHD